MRDEGAAGVICMRPTTEELLSCPFCGCEEAEVINTHTPSYWVECNNCNGSAHGECFNVGNKKSEKVAHKMAFLSAIKAWNLRP